METTIPPPLKLKRQEQMRADDDGKTPMKRYYDKNREKILKQKKEYYQKRKQNKLEKPKPKKHTIKIKLTFDGQIKKDEIIKIINDKINEFEEV